MHDAAKGWMCCAVCLSNLWDLNKLTCMQCSNLCASCCVPGTQRWSTSVTPAYRNLSRARMQWVEQSDRSTSPQPSSDNCHHRSTKRQTAALTKGMIEALFTLYPTTMKHLYRAKISSGIIILSVYTHPHMGTHARVRYAWFTTPKTDYEQGLTVEENRRVKGQACLVLKEETFQVGFEGI